MSLVTNWSLIDSDEKNIDKSIGNDKNLGKLVDQFMLTDEIDDVIKKFPSAVFNRGAILDSVEDLFSIYRGKGKEDDHISELYPSYPSSPMLGASVVDFAAYNGSQNQRYSTSKRSNDSDILLNMLSSTYKNSNRSNTNILSKRRINMITKQGKTIVLEFDQFEVEYWHFIQAVKQVLVISSAFDPGLELPWSELSDGSVFFNGKCLVPSKSSICDTPVSESPAIKKLEESKSKSILGSIFRGRDAPNNNQPISSPKSQLHHIIIKGTNLYIVEEHAKRAADGSIDIPDISPSTESIRCVTVGKDIVVVLNLLDLKCMTLGADYESVKSYLLCVRFTDCSASDTISRSESDAVQLNSPTRSDTSVLSHLEHISGPPGSQNLMLKVQVNKNIKDAESCMYGRSLSVAINEKELIGGVAAVSVLSNEGIQKPGDPPVVVGDSALTFGSMEGMVATAKDNLRSNVNLAASPVRSPLQKTPSLDLRGSCSLDSNSTLEVPLFPPVRGFAARLGIKHAQGLMNNPITKGVPSAYCVAYLMNSKGEKITLNQSDRRTSVAAKGNNPIWNSTITLRENMFRGVDNAANVYVKLVDNGNFGASVHLGQVIIPIECFLEGTQAELTLPLEASYRMNEMIESGMVLPNNYGEITVTTELVPMTSKDDHLGQKDSSCQIAKLEYFVTETSSELTWWPCRQLLPDKLISTLQDTVGMYEILAGFEDLVIRRSRRQMNNVNSSSDLQGCLENLFRPTPAGSAEDLAPSGSIRNSLSNLKAAAKNVAAKRLSVTFGNNLRGNSPVKEDPVADCLIHVPYMQILEACPLSETVLLLKIILQCSTPKRTDSLKNGSVKLMPEQFLPKEVEILVAPCAAVKLMEVLLERRHLTSVRSELSLWASRSRLMLPKILPVPQNEISALTMLRPVQDLVVRRASLVDSDFQIDSTLSVPRSVAVALESMAEANILDLKQIHGVEDGDYHAFLSVGTNRNYICFLRNGEVRQGKLVTSGFSSLSLYFRLRLYYTVLRFWVSNFVQELDLAGNDRPTNRFLAALYRSAGADKKASLSEEDRLTLAATVDDNAMTALLDRDLNYAAKQQPISMAHKANVLGSSVVIKPLYKDQYDSSDIVRRMEWILDLALKHIRDVILFYYCKNSSPSRDPGWISTIFACVHGYHNGMRAIILPFIESKEAFYDITAEDVRTGIIRYLVSKNRSLECSIKSILSLLGLQCYPMLPLISEEYLDSLIEWYGQHLLIAVKSWLAKLLVHAFTVRKDGIAGDKRSANIPWDVTISTILTDEKPTLKNPSKQEMKYYISAVPETFRMQINVFLELCESSTLCAGFVDATGMVCVDAANTVNARRHLLLLNEKVVSALAKSFIMLVDEYERAVLSKHWSVGTSDDEIAENLSFIVSVCNDLYRLREYHAKPLLKIATLTNQGKDLVEQVIQSLNNVHTKAAVQIVRMIFTDLQRPGSGFMDYTAVWLAAHNASSQTFDVNASSFLVKTLIATLKDYFEDLMFTMEVTSFAKVVLQCCDISVLRFLSFIKEIARLNHKLTMEQVLSLKDDVKLMVEFFAMTICQCVLLVDQSSRYAILKLLLEEEMFHAVVEMSFPGETVKIQEVRLETIEFAPESLIVLCRAIIRKLRNIVDVNNLVSMEAENPQLNLLCKRIWKTYSSSIEYRPIVANLLTCCLVTLRDDGVELIELVESLIHSAYDTTNHLSEELSVERDDLFVRVFRDDEEIRLHDVFKEYMGKEETKVDCKPTGRPGSVNLDRGKASIGRAINALKKFKSKSIGLILAPDDSDDNDSTPQLGNTVKKFLGIAPSNASVATEEEDDNKVTVNPRSSFSSFHSLASAFHSDARKHSFDRSGNDIQVIFKKLMVRGLKSHSLLGYANPYCAVIVAVNNKIDDNSQRVKSSVLWNVKDEGSWDSKSGGIPDPLYLKRSELERSTLTIYVYDKERISRKRFLGGVSNIKLNSIDILPIDTWIAIDPTITVDNHQHAGAAAGNGAIVPNQVREVYLSIEVKAI